MSGRSTGGSPILKGSKAYYDDLAARMLGLDEQALREFFDHFAPMLRAYFLSRGLTAADADDLSISTVTQTALKIHRYKAAQGNLRSLVLTLARHELSDWRHRHRVEPGAIDDRSLLKDSNVVQAVTDALAKLSEVDRIIIQQRHLEGQGFDEIGERLGITPRAARARHVRALKQVRRALEADDRLSELLRFVRTSATDP